MCICQYCGILGFFLGEIIYAIQKVIQCAAIGSVFTCLMFSLTIMLMLGVGMGYNHCYVEIRKPNHRGWWWWRSGENKTIKDLDDPYNDYDMWYNETRQKRSQNQNTSAPEDNATTEDTPLLPTMIIPVNTTNNILKIISKIRKRRLNITLHFIAK